MTTTIKGTPQNALAYAKEITTAKWAVEQYGQDVYDLATEFLRLHTAAEQHRSAKATKGAWENRFTKEG